MKFLGFEEFHGFQGKCTMLSLHPRSIRGQIFSEISNHIALDRHTGGAPRKTGGGSGIDTRRVIHKIGVEARCFDLIIAQIPCQLVDNCSDHFQVSEFLGA